MKVLVFGVRPGIIQPMHGERPKSRAYRIGYVLLGPVIPLLRRMLPGYVTTTERVGRAMLHVAKRGHPTPFIEHPDVNRLGSASS